MSANHLSQETIGAYVDREFSPAAEAEAQLHLQDCHACALRILAAQQLKSATRQSAPRFTPSADALARLTAQAKQLPPKKATVIPMRTVLWSAIAALLLVTVSLAGLRQSHQTTTLTAELLDQHLASLSPSSAPQVISTDRHTVKPWFQGKLPFSFNLPEPTALPPDTTLEGADFTYLEGKPAALLLFHIHKHQASVFITQAGQVPTLDLHKTQSGFNLSRVRTAGLDLAAVSDVNRPELDALVTTLVSVQ